MRIHELARELDVSSKELLETLEKMGVTGKSASSSVPEDLVPRLRASGGKATKAAKPRQVMEPPPKPRAKPKPKPKPKAAPAPPGERRPRGTVPPRSAVSGSRAGARRDRSGRPPPRARGHGFGPDALRRRHRTAPAPSPAAPHRRRSHPPRPRRPRHLKARSCRWFEGPPHSSSPRRPTGPRPTS